jgi:hypothetical protein
MSSASNGLAATGVGVRGSAQPDGEKSGRMYKERMVARPSEPVSCGSPAGIHSARVGGSTQVASWVSTVSTPLAAQASWWSSWVCQSKRVPAGMGKVATTTAVPSCPARDTTWQLTR